MTKAIPSRSRGAGIHSPGCKKCGFNGAVKPDAWCPQCGYYPKLGRCVDLGTSAVPQQEEPLEAGPIEVPRWFWMMLAGSVGIIVMSLVARFIVPADGPLAIWSLVQLIIGLVILAICHIQAYTIAAGQTDKLGPADMFLHPWEVWRPTLQELPDGNGRVCNAAWGATAALCAMFVVGGMTEDQIGDLITMGVQRRNRPNLIQHIMSNVRASGGGDAGAPAADGEAIEEFTQALGVDQLGQVEETVEPEKSQIICLVIGYTRSVSGDIRSLLIADTLEGRPRRYVGKVLTQDIDASVVNHVEAMIPKLARPHGSVACPIRAYWLEPSILCLVEYDEQDAEYLLSGAKVVSLEAAADYDDAEAAVAGEEATDPPPAGSAPSAGDGAQATSSSSSSSSSS